MSDEKEIERRKAIWRIAYKGCAERHKGALAELGRTVAERYAADKKGSRDTNLP